MIGALGLHRLFDTWLKRASHGEHSGHHVAVSWASLEPAQQDFLSQLSDRYEALLARNAMMTVDAIAAEAGTVPQLMNIFSTFKPETMEFLSRSATTVLLAAHEVSEAFGFEIAPIRGHQPICTHCLSLPLSITRARQRGEEGAADYAKLQQELDDHLTMVVSDPSLW
jgi:hypothetical protein